MKKKLLNLIIFLLIFSSLFGAVTTQNYKSTTKPIVLQGAIKESYFVNITPIPSGASNFLIGLPFNIEGEDVKNTSEGRPIANWTFLSNANFHLTISATPLIYIEDVNGTPRHDPLYYNLILDFEISYKKENGDNYMSYQKGSGIYYPGEDTNEERVVFKKGDSELIGVNSLYEFLGITSSDHPFIGEMNGRIRLRFTEKTTQYILDNHDTTIEGTDNLVLPSGEYIGTVTFTLESR